MRRSVARARAAALAALAGTLLAPDAFAHSTGGIAGGLASGLLHPLTGADHLVAMVAVGLWGSVLGAPALWALPIAFPLIMALGGLLGVAGVPLPFAEVFIALSGIVLGGAIALRWRAPLPVAVALVSVFAVFHGHAHGVELPRAADPLAYGIGFVTATGLLHATGIALGTLDGRPAGRRGLQAAGVLIALVGTAFLVRSTGVVP